MTRSRLDGGDGDGRRVLGPSLVNAHYGLILLQFLCFLFRRDSYASPCLGYAALYEPRCEKTGLRGFRPGPTRTGLCNH